MELKVGTTLILEPTHTDRIEKFKCRVVEQEGNILYIDYPVNTITKKTAFLVDGAQFRATFNDDYKQSYAFTTEVLGREKKELPMILLNCPKEDEFIKIQRREYVRVETPVDVAVNIDGEHYQYIVSDISAGGILINLRGTSPFEPGDEIKILLVLPFNNGEIRYVNTSAFVVRHFELDDRSYASLQFTDTDDLDKQFIVRFCFERQLQYRKKELNEFY